VSTGALRLVLGDQLSAGLSSLRDLDRGRDTVLMLEVAAEADHVPHHRKKIAFILAAMRAFAAELRARGVSVRYVTLDDPHNTQSFTGEVRRAVQQLRPDRLVVTEPGEWRVLEMIRAWDLVPVEIRADDRFLCSLADFRAWAGGRRQLRLELFYRMMRERTGILMDRDGPVGGRWNFDAENRKRLPDGMATHVPARFTADATTRAVLDLIARRFPDRFGDLEPFWFATTRAQALVALEHFVAWALPAFGDYQDAMRQGDDWLFHSALSQYLNVGLLLPLEVCRRAERAFHEGAAPLNAVEGFIRQILGWREYVRGLYWLEMPGYARRNALGATAPLPDFYWTGDTDLNCVAQVVDQTRREALSHHIQRLMVTGQLAMLLGVLPEAICTWYLAVYADAFEWVELPNTLGMAIFADGGRMASKPYAASGAYIDRMSDFCRHCRYDVRQKAGPDACPFNYLYWDFMIEQRARIGTNPRLGPVYRTLDRMSPARIAEIRADAHRFRASLQPWRQAS
jgi:deoxyribodipyrimidine photolyase-related protein